MLIFFLLTVIIVLICRNEDAASEETASGAFFMAGNDEDDLDMTCNESVNTVVPSHREVQEKAVDHAKNTIYSNALNEDLARFSQTNPTVSAHEALSLRLEVNAVLLSRLIVTMYRTFPQAIAKHVTNSLRRYGWAIVDNLMGDRHAQRIADECVALYDANLFKEGHLLEQASGITAL